MSVKVSNPSKIVKTLSAFIIGLLITSNIAAQSAKIDSFRERLNNTSISDTLRVLLLTEFSKELARLKPDSAMYFANQAFKIAGRAGYKEGKAESLSARGWIKINNQKFVEGYEDYTEALKLFTETRNKKGKATVLYELGVLYDLQDQSSKALAYFKNALNLYDGLNDAEGQESCYRKIAAIYQKHHNYDKSLPYYQKLLQLFERTRNLVKIAAAYNDISANYNFTKQYNKSLDVAFRARQIGEENNAIPVVADAYQNIGFAYSRIGQTELADSSFLKALSLNKTLKRREQIGKTYNYLGALYFRKAKNDKAKEFLYSAIYVATALNNRELKYKAYATLVDINKSENKFLSASRYYEKMLSLKDSLYDAEKNISLKNLKSSYELDKKQAQIQEIEQENISKKQQRNYLSIAICTVLILMFLLLLSIINIKRKKKTLAIQKNELKDLNELKDKLFSILNHDLRSPIDDILVSLDMLGNGYSLNSLQRNNLVEKLKLSASSAHDTMDNMLKWGDHHLNNNSNFRKTVRVQEIIEKVCVLLSETASSKSITIINKVTEPLVATADENQLEFVLRNLLSNAIKFSYPNSKVVIRARKLNANTYIYIKDSGIGMNKEMQDSLFNSEKRVISKGTAGETGSGFGLLLSKEFIDKNYGTLLVKSEEGEGTTFAIKLPG